MDESLRRFLLILKLASGRSQFLLQLLRVGSRFGRLCPACPLGRQLLKQLLGDRFLLCQLLLGSGQFRLQLPEAGIFHPRALLAIECQVMGERLGLFPFMLEPSLQSIECIAEFACVGFMIHILSPSVAPLAD